MNNEILKQARNEEEHSFGWMRRHQKDAAALIEKYQTHIQHEKHQTHIQHLSMTNIWKNRQVLGELNPSLIYRLDPAFVPPEYKPRKLTWDIAFGPESGAPEWAVCAFLSDNGTAYLADEVPNMDAALLDKYGCPQVISGCSQRFGDCFDASNWRTTIIMRERANEKPTDWRDDYDRYEVQLSEYGVLSIMTKCYPYSLSDCNSIPGAVFEWAECDFEPYFLRPRIRHEGFEMPKDPRTLTYIYPAAVWLPKRTAERQNGRRNE